MTAVLLSDRRRRQPHRAELAARARKAALIAAVLERVGCDAASAEHLDGAGRSAAAALAGVPAPSDATWHAVVGVLQAHEQTRAVIAPNVEALVQ